MRQSPLLIVYKGISIVRNAIFFYFLLFILKDDFTGAIFEFGRAAFWYVLGFSIVYTIVHWATTTFTVNNEQLTMRSGIITRKTQQVPIAQLEQVTVNKHWFHRLTNTIGCTYQLADANETLKIDMISALQMEQLLKKKSEPNKDNDVIFQPSHKQLLKASFTSLRFLLAIPLLGSLYSKVDHFIHLEQYTTTLVENVKTNTSWLVATIIAYVIFSILSAIAFTFIKFGRDQVVKKGDELIIRKGVINESKVTLDVAAVTGIEIRQSFLKRLLGLAEIRLQFKSNDANELQSIYPYFEYEQAVAFINTHFPAFAIHTEHQRLTKVSLIPKMMRTSMIILFIWLGCFLGRDWLPVEYYSVATILSLVTIIGMLLAYQQFQFSLQGEQMQLRKGVFGSSVSTIRLRHISDVQLEQTLLQRWLGLQTMSVRAYSDRLAEYQLKDVRVEGLQTVQQAYLALRKI